MFLGLGELVHVGTQDRSESALVFNDNILVRHTGTRNQERLTQEFTKIIVGTSVMSYNYRTRDVKA